MTKPKRIFIVGHMGAGKAVLSEALAKKLGWQYIDANPSLERYIGRSLNEILGKQGEVRIITHREHPKLLMMNSQYYLS